VLFVVTHMELGVRGVLLAHGISPFAADRAAWATGARVAVLSVTITAAS